MLGPLIDAEPPNMTLGLRRALTAVDNVVEEFVTTARMGIAA